MRESRPMSSSTGAATNPAGNTIRNTSCEDNTAGECTQPGPFRRRPATSKNTQHVCCQASGHDEKLTKPRLGPPPTCACAIRRQPPKTASVPSQRDTPRGASSTCTLTLLRALLPAQTPRHSRTDRPRNYRSARYPRRHPRGFCCDRLGSPGGAWKQIGSCLGPTG